jgi:putative redox protein
MKTKTKLVKCITSIEQNLYTKNFLDGKFTIYADEPIDLEGDDLAPNPLAILTSALASCSIISIKLFAAKEKIDLGDMSLNITVYKTDQDYRFLFKRKFSFTKELTIEESSKILLKAEDTPITNSLKIQHDILTEIVNSHSLIKTN